MRATDDPYLHIRRLGYVGVLLVVKDDLKNYSQRQINGLRGLIRAGMKEGDINEGYF